MNNEDSSVLDLLRQAVKVAASNQSEVGGAPNGLVSTVLSGPENNGIGAQALPQASSPVMVGVVNGLTGLLGGSTEKPAWMEWVSRVNPVAGLIAGLFAGRREDAESAPPVASYLRPENLRLEAGFDGTNNPAIGAVERQEGGQFRPAATANGGAQVIVQVQAMDSRSFLDHTPEIAEAVKRALLESNGLRDVLGEY